MSPTGVGIVVVFGLVGRTFAACLGVRVADEITQAEGFQRPQQPGVRHDA